MNVILLDFYHVQSSFSKEVRLSSINKLSSSFSLISLAISSHPWRIGFNTISLFSTEILIQVLSVILSLRNKAEGIINPLLFPIAIIFAFIVITFNWLNSIKVGIAL